MGIVGASGMGKSRFLAALCRSLRGKSIVSLVGRCRFHGRTAPYLPVCDVIRYFCRITEADHATTMTTKVQRRLMALGLDPDEYAPYLLQLLGLSTGAERLTGHSQEALDAHSAAPLCQMSLHTSTAYRKYGTHRFA